MINNILVKIPKNIIISRFIPISTNLITNKPYNIIRNLSDFIYYDEFRGNNAQGFLETIGYTNKYNKFSLEISMKDLLLQETISLLRENYIDYKLSINYKTELLLYMDNNNIDMNMFYSKKILDLIYKIECTNITNKYIITK